MTFPPSARYAVVAGVLLFPAGCAQNLPTAPSAAAVLDGAAAATHRTLRELPFSGRCDTEIAVLPALPGDPPNLQRLHIEYVCQLQHLGRTTAVNEQTVTFTGPTSGTSENSTVYTAANGDQLFSTWTGTVEIFEAGNVVIFRGPETYSGGTGRFENASGSSLISGVGSFVTRAAQFTLTGTLTY